MPPSADQAIWHSAIADQAKAAGLSLVVGDAAPKGTSLVLTQSAEAAIKSGAKLENMAVLLSQAGPLASPFDGAEPNTERHPVVLKSTDLLCRALELPDDRRFTANQLANGPVRLFKDFSLSIPNAIPAEISRRNRALLGAFAVYDQDEVIWSPDILDVYAEITDRSAHSLTLDATGKPRFIFHGPYISMPAGTWTIEANLDFEAPLCDKAFTLHWGGMTEFSRLDFRPEKAGTYRLVMDWTWDQPAPCEFRLIGAEGIFDGHITLSDMKLTRTGPSASADIRSAAEHQALPTAS